MNRIILHVDMNSYFASVEQAANPLLRGKPIAVGGGIGKRTVVATSSYEARARGVKTGMPTWEALKKCPELIVVTGDMNKYVYTSKEIIKMLRDYTDLVEVFSIDEAFLDVTRVKDGYGGEIEIAKDIKRRIKERFRLTCSIGIGPNKLVAKLASEMKKPDGLTKIGEDEISIVFEFIPVEDLCGVGRQLKKRLNSLGIRMCSDLAKYPVQRLVSKFGLVCGVHLSNMGKGIDDDPVDPQNNIKDAKSISHSYTLPKDESDPDIVKSYLLRLSEQVGRRARKYGYKGRVVSLYLRYGDFSGYGRQKNIHDYIDDGYDVYISALSMVEMERPIRLVGVALSDLIRNADQLSLFDQEGKKRAALAAMDEINDRYGDFTVTRASIIYNELAEKTGMTSRQKLEPDLNQGETFYPR
ncbi:MAG: DNA polymerase IV [Candidatus Margulisiibacteriota bacterium]